MTNPFTYIPVTNYRVCHVGYLLEESIRQCMPGPRACTSEGLGDQASINQHQLYYLFNIYKCFCFFSRGQACLQRLIFK